MKNFVKNAWIAVRMIALMTLLLGFAYPTLVTAIAWAAFPGQAGGSLVRKDGVVVGSELLGQKVTSRSYFWPRPSANDWNSMASGGSNLGPTSSALKEAVDARRSKLMADHAGEGEPPGDLLFASGSGLDPHVTLPAARWQIARVAAARGLQPSVVLDLVNEASEMRQFGILGEPRANVLKLNLLLDDRFGRPE